VCFFTSCCICEMAEEVATGAGHNERRKRPAYPRKALEQKQNEVCFSLHFVFVKWPRR